MWVWDAEQTDPDRFGLLPTKYVVCPSTNPVLPILVLIQYDPSTNPVLTCCRYASSEGAVMDLVLP